MWQQGCKQTSEIKHQVLGALWQRCDLFCSIFLCTDFHWNFATVQGCCFWLQGQRELRVIESSLKSKFLLKSHSELNQIEIEAFLKQLMEFHRKKIKTQSKVLLLSSDKNYSKDFELWPLYFTKLSIYLYSAIHTNFLKNTFL